MKYGLTAYTSVHYMVERVFKVNTPKSWHSDKPQQINGFTND